MLGDTHLSIIVMCQLQLGLPVALGGSGFGLGQGLSVIARHEISLRMKLQKNYKQLENKVKEGDLLEEHVNLCPQFLEWLLAVYVR